MPYKDPEQRRAYWQRWYAEKKESEAARKARWARENPEKNAARVRLWRRRQTSGAAMAAIGALEGAGS